MKENLNAEEGEKECWAWDHVQDAVDVLMIKEEQTLSVRTCNPQISKF